MGNTGSSDNGDAKHRRKSGGKKDDFAGEAQKVVSEGTRALQKGLASVSRKLEDEGHPAASLIDAVCGPVWDNADDRGGSSDTRKKSSSSGGRKSGRARSYYSQEESSADSRTVSEDDEASEFTEDNPPRRRGGGRKDEEETVESASYLSQSDYESQQQQQQQQPSRSSSKSKQRRKDESSYDDSVTEEDYEDDTYATRTEASGVTSTDDNETATLLDETTTAAASAAPEPVSALAKQPLASSFARRCYFTKQGIGSQTQHYEGLTLTGNVVLMLAAAMKLKGCPTICDEDLRRVEQTYPNQFSRLPDELLLSSGWRRISKYCHFSNKPIPDGIPFFHSKKRLHPSGGYYFLLASAVGMVRPIDVEPLTRDTLVLLETDYPTQCDAAPEILIKDPTEWTLVDKFCFFSGGPINTDEDVYYQADFDGNPIYMLAFLSPSLTPAELYKLDESALLSTQAVEEVESVYDLTERDFDDLKLYHLGPCRALPQYILQPQAWTKVLPPHFLAARQTALLRAQEYEKRHGIAPSTPTAMNESHDATMHSNNDQTRYMEAPPDESGYYGTYGQHQQHQMPPQPSPYEHHPSPYGQPSPQKHYGQQRPHYEQQSPYGQQPPQQEDYEHPPYGQHQQFHEQQSPYRQQPAQHSFDQQPHYGQQQSPQHPYEQQPYGQHQHEPYEHQPSMRPPYESVYHQQDPGALDTSLPMDEAIASHMAARAGPPAGTPPKARLDPPEDEPPSLSRRGQSVVSAESSQAGSSTLMYDQNAGANGYYHGEQYYGSSVKDGDNDQDDYDHGYYEEEQIDAAPPEEEAPDGEPESGTVPTGEDEFGSPEPSFDSGRGQNSPEERRRDPGLPPQSPRSPASQSSEYSQSSAMRGAQELLRRNRQRRMEMARKLKRQEKPGPEDEDFGASTQSQTEMESGLESGTTTWETGSDITGSELSSVWTDEMSDVNADRSSRRALILQMARARMKSNKDAMNEVQEEKKLDQSSAADIDLTGDLD